MVASPTGDIILGRLHGSLNVEFIARRSHRQLADVVTGQLQGARVPNPRLGIVGISLPSSLRADHLGRKTLDP